MVAPAQSALLHAAHVQRAEGGLDRMSDMCQARIHDGSYTAAIVTTLVLCVLHVVMVGSHICPELCV